MELFTRKCHIHKYINIRMELIYHNNEFFEYFTINWRYYGQRIVRIYKIWFRLDASKIFHSEQWSKLSGHQCTQLRRKAKFLGNTYAYICIYICIFGSDSR